MSGEREAVEARARAHREKNEPYLLDFMELARESRWEDRFAADFSLAENAELSAELKKTQRAFEFEFDKRTAAEAEVVKLRERLRLIQWRLDEYMGAEGIISSPEECRKQSEASWNALTEAIESALNPGAAKEG
jgi:hypothetical protein